jgi:adenosylcobinamide-phosphate synthase
MPPAATLAVLAALAIDRAVGEPTDRWHPVAWFGRLVAPVDREWRHPRVVGALAALALPLVAAGAVGGTVLLAASAHVAAGTVVATLALFATTSLRSLVDTASEVAALTETDLDAAREDLLALAGRDASELSAGEVRSAAVESCAENLADGLVAPLGAFAVLAGLVGAGGAGLPLALGAAAAAAAWVKAVNTLDSMLGYREKAVGTASARLDDVVMWIPARASALLLAVAAGAPRALAAARPLARRPASPNSGWPMATLAVSLGVRLAKPGAYDLDAGQGFPSVAESERGVRTVARAGVLATVLAGVVAWP